MIKRDIKAKQTTRRVLVLSRILHRETKCKGKKTFMAEETESARLTDVVAQAGGELERRLLLLVSEWPSASYCLEVITVICTQAES